jgi:uncharacterized protein (DUF4415 family)
MIFCVQGIANSMMYTIIESKNTTRCVEILTKKDRKIAKIKVKMKGVTENFSEKLKGYQTKIEEANAKKASNSK